MATLLPLLLASSLVWLDPTAVHPGQRGVCVTEWSGGERWEIPIEVMGVLDAPAPERTTVLIRLDDERFAEAGVVQGMSGSPVYIDGKLLGAVAFGWPFARTPLAGVTPFAAMARIAPGGQPASVSGPRLSELAAVASGHSEPFAALRPIPLPSEAGALPLAVAGFPQRSGEILAPFGVRSIPAAGDADLSGAPEPGEMVAALLVWGDATVAAGGTVTAREGDLLWAFGHPFLNLGGVRLPAARARVLAVQESFEVPFKFFAVGEPFGAVVADRLQGILARLGEVPAGLPVTVTVREPLGDAVWHFWVAEIPIIEPLLVTYLTNACLTARGASAGLATVDLRLDLHFRDGRTVRIDQAIQGLDALARVAGFVGTVVGFVANSPFPHPDLTKVEVGLRRQERGLGATITEVTPARTTVRPGERLDILVRLQPDGEPPAEIRLAVKVPATLPAGKVDLIVADGAAWSEYRLKAEGIEPATFADQLAQLATLESSTNLVAILERRSDGVALPGASQPDLPPSWSATLATGLGPGGGLTRLSTAVVAAVRQQMATPLIGAFRVPLTVRNRLPEVP